MRAGKCDRIEGRDKAELVDRLVDDELDESERRELLARLDGERDGWRRVALAFLEGQSWRREMRGLAQPAAPPSPPAASGARRPWIEGRASTVLAMAACFLIALGLGTFLRDLATHDAGGPVQPVRLADRGAVLVEESPSPERRAPAVPEADEPWQLVTLGVDPGEQGGRCRVQLPAVERPGIDEQWVEGLESPIPEEVLRALRRSGHKIESTRQYVPLRMKDGRQLVVPVDQVDVHYVGGKRGFQ